MNVEFDEAAHIYRVDGVVLPSVTEVCRFLSYDLKSDRPWLAKAAAERGSRVHADCALMDYGEVPEDTPENRGYLKAYRRFLADYRPDWQGIEYLTASKDLGIAGTVDRFGTLYDGIPCVLDIKTGAKLHRVPIRAQLTSYARLLEREETPFCAQRLYGLRLGKDGTYELMAVLMDDELLRCCMYLQQATQKKGMKPWVEST